jgi:hypothetical protein
MRAAQCRASSIPHWNVNGTVSRVAGIRVLRDDGPAGINAHGKTTDGITWRRAGDVDGDGRRTARRTALVICGRARRRADVSSNGRSATTGYVDSLYLCQGGTLKIRSNTSILFRIASRPPRDPGMAVGLLITGQVYAQDGSLKATSFPSDLRLQAREDLLRNA